MDIQVAAKSGEKKSLRIEETDGLVVKASQLGAFTDAAGKALDPDYPLIRVKGSDVFLTVPEGLQGKLGNESFAALRKAGKVRIQKGIEIYKLESGVGAFELGEHIVKVKLQVSSGASAAAQAPATPAKAAGGNMTDKPAPQAASAAAGSSSGPHGRPLSSEQREKRQNPVFLISAILAFLLHAGFIGYLANLEVPDDFFDDGSQIPERFARLIMEEEPEEEEPVEEEGSEGAGVEEVATEEEAGDEGGGGDESEETAAPREKSREEKRANVRSKGVLALITSKGGGGSALADVLSNGAGLGESLDSALGKVSGVGTAGPGVDIRQKRGGGGAGKAGIGSLAAGKGRSGGLGTKKVKKVVASIQTGEFDTSGSLSADAIRQVVQKNLKKIKLCYNRELSKNPDLKGKIEVSFDIGPDGKVKNYKIKSSSMKNKTVEDCMLKRIRRFKFPKPEKGSVKVVYPFVFTASG